MTRVGVNLLWLVPGEVGGSETWATGLLRHLVEARNRPGADVVVFATPALLDAHPWLRGYEVVVAPTRVGPSRALRVAAESTWLALAARRAGVDVLHHPGGTIPSVRLSPALLTIHDLQPLHNPDAFHPVKRAYLQARLRPSSHRARLVTAVSAFTRDDIVERLGVPAERVALTPPAVDPAPPPGAVGVDDIAATLRLDRPWFLFPAITYEHKRHATLVRALVDVPDALLVLTGGPGPMEQSVRDLAARLGVADRVRRTGRIPDEQLDALYRGAVACAFPSAFEAVGLPVLEAMARGCAVLAADSTALPAVVGAAGELLPVDDVGAWSAAMNRILGDDARRASLAALGRERVKAWSPGASGGLLVEAWERAAR